MKQLLVSGFPTDDGVLELSDADLHYLFTVRRLRDGASLLVRLPDARQVRAVVATIGGERRLVCRVGEDEGPAASSTPTPGSGPRLRLLLGYPKGKKLEQSIRQACELGVHEIVPLLCERSIPDPEAGSWRRKKQRLETIIAEAAQQSGAAPSLLADPVKPAEWLRRELALAAATRPADAGADAGQSAAIPSTITLNSGTTRAFYFHESAAGSAGLHEYLHTNPEDIVVCVGPEGGFSAGETALFDGAGFAPVWLGPTILRCETAVVAAISCIALVLREADSWRTPV